MSKEQPSPTPRVWLSGFFGTIAVGHIARALTGWTVVIAGREIPLSWSGIIGGAALVISLGLLFLGRRQRTSPPNLP